MAKEDEASEDEDSNIFDDNVIIDRLPEDKASLVSLLGEVKQKIKEYKQVFLK